MVRAGRLERDPPITLAGDLEPHRQPLTVELGGERTLLEEPPDELGQRLPTARRPDTDLAVQLGPAKIEVAMAKPQIFSGQLFTFSARNRNRRRICSAEHSDRSGMHFDVAGLHFWIAHLVRTPRDCSFDANDRLLAQ